MKTILLLALVLFPLTMAQGFEEPAGFREAKWGDSEDVVRTKLGIAPPMVVPGGTVTQGAVVHQLTLDTSCYAHPAESRWLGDRSCRAETTIGDIVTKAIFTFRGDKLVGVNLTFAARHFDQMQAAFVQRFGAPQSAKDSITRTRAGVEYMNRELSWEGPIVVIDLLRYGADINHSLASYRLLSDVRRSDEIRSEGAAKASRGLD